MPADGARPVIAIGFRVHLGWANAVTLEGVPDAARLVDRRDVDLRPAGASDAVHPFGAARQASPEDRDRVLQLAIEELELAATDALADVTTEVAADAGGIVVSRDSLLRIPIDRILGSSSLYHTASGVLYQQGLRRAFAHIGLPCSTVRFDEAESSAEWDAVSAIGREAGPPWRKDHKFAAVAAWRAALDVTPAR